MKFMIIKGTADGEQISAEVHLDKDMLNLHRGSMKGGQLVRVHLREQLAPLFDLVDARLLEMNHRVMASNYMIQRLSPEAHLAIVNVMDVLHGKTPGPQVEALVEQAKQEALDARKKGEEAREAEKAERTAAERAEREAAALLAQAEEQGLVQGGNRRKRKHVEPPSDLSTLPVGGE